MIRVHYLVVEVVFIKLDVLPCSVARGDIMYGTLFLTSIQVSRDVSSPLTPK